MEVAVLLLVQELLSVRMVSCMKIYYLRKIYYTVLQIDQTNLNKHSKPQGFDDWKIEQKRLFYGLESCVKSRTIIEFIKNNLADFQRIYILIYR